MPEQWVSELRIKLMLCEYYQEGGDSTKEITCEDNLFARVSF